MFKACHDEMDQVVYAHKAAAIINAGKWEREAASNQSGEAFEIARRFTAMY